ncbi:MAG: Lrp/AsnC ligand binding domain-containing protein [Lentisphaerae bacterium]|nr:Lrp/AsnC ligand binding domain-containing protein [Lentisphaerota bacterium]MBT4820586.1 Lrp/AsnC ligand binding domain-containing protein [Lentisphaerota bacterium]MBT5611481.1 Lrp/AsnC ligand binding domain-containing protein [Lentisphaerota bacterium]MBT7056343.1 Lrp/AsnC ligand binding domain-containing protein [Lentisphaerota bacterium]MBT7842981.1 Lrp/AsnC ligand binding domain-containing protein [Lentisphaerota bacterium]
MVTAFVLINVQDRNVQKIGDELLGHEGVKEAHVVAGEYDMVAVVRVADNSTLSHLITNEIAHIDGVERTKTLFALQSFSAYDLSSIFDVI